MFTQYARLSQAELDRMRRLDPDAAFDYVDELAEWIDGAPVAGQRGLLLDGTPPDLGGTAVPDTDWGQGPPVVLTPVEVVVAAAGLPAGELAEFMAAAAESGDAVVTWRS